MMRCEKWLAVGTVVALGLGAVPAWAQLTGGPIEPANPGGVSIGVEAGYWQTQLARYRNGEVFDTINPTPPPGGIKRANSFDDRNFGVGVVPSGALSFGLPNGLFGAPAEIWGRFSYHDSTNTLNTTAANSTFFPYIDGLRRNSPPFFQSFVVFATGSPLTVERDQTNYDFEAGARVHYMMGNIRVSPNVFFGYERIDQRDVFNKPSTGDVAVFNVKTNLHSDYYRFGAGLGTSLPVTCLGPSVSWFNYFSASADVVRSDFKSNQAVTFLFFTPAAGPPDPSSASASGSNSGVSGRATIQTGFVNQSSPMFSQYVAAGARWVGRVPFVDYPQSVNGTAVTTHPAQLGSQDQLSYGFVAGFNIRF